MKKISMLVLSVLTALTVSSQTIVKKVSSGLAIDGHLSEEFWEITNPISINSGGSDNTANFGLLWDDNYLYVGVEVTDKLLCNGRRQGFYDDGIEICIDGHHNQSARFDDNDLQLVKPVKSFWVQEMNDNYEGIVNKCMPTASGYSMEFAIPWSIINTMPAANNLVGFNVIVNDDDDPFNSHNNPAQLIWAGNSSYYQSPQNWGSIQLSPQTVSFSASYLALLSPNEGEFLINEKNTSIEWFSYGVDKVKIEYSTDNGTQWTSIAESTNAASGSYQWQTNATPSEQFLIRISDASDNAISDKSDRHNIVSETLTTTEILIPSLWHNYMWPYNANFPEMEKGINGHIGNSCGSSSLARIIHSWEFPRRGSNSLSFTDNYGTHWQADFKNTIYDYDNMPNNLPWEATEAQYADVATLVYHSAVAMNDFYGSGTNLQNMSYAMSHYFNYKESDIAYMHDYTPAEWTQLLKNEIDNGRSMLIQAMNLNYFGGWHTSNSIGGHWYHCDGYNEDGEFHIIVGFGNYQYDGYYSIDEFPIYSYNIGLLTGLEPDLDGKTLSLTQPKGGEVYTAGNVAEITWQSSGISNLQIEYTLDNGQNWIEIEAATNANAGSYFWTTPENSTDQCKIRLTDADNINLYDKSDDAFKLIPLELALICPAGGESYVSNDIALIAWKPTQVAEVDIELSTDNGSTWNTLISNYDASQEQYEWEATQNTTNQGLIRVSDSKNGSNNSVSKAVFSIVPENSVGGPYKNDANTLLLLHAEGNLYNQSARTGNVSSTNGTISYTESTIDDLGKSIYLDNSSGSPYLVLPHTSDLNLTDDWTIELWFKPLAYKPGLQYLMWKPGDDDEYFSNYSILLSEYWGNELYGFYFSGDDRVGVRTMFYPQLNEWYHIALVRSTSNSSLNMIVRDPQRELVGTYSITDNGANPLINSQDVRIGFNFNGYVDEIRISDVVRSYEPTIVEGIAIADDIVIRPNPASSFFNLNNKKEMKVSIYTATGICVKNNCTVQPNESIDISNLSSGMYFILINTSKNILSKKIIIN